MVLHVEALFTHDVNGCLAHGNEPSHPIAPRFFLGQTLDGPVLRFRDDVGAAVRRELTRVAKQLPNTLDAIDPTPFQLILSRAAPVAQTETGPAFVFLEDAAPNEAVRITAANAKCLESLLSAWRGDVELCQPMMVLVRDGSAVSICASVRTTPRADEAGLETAPAFRGQGYATIVVPAWARAVRAAGRIPLYSTSWENQASRGVAAKLHLTAFGSDLHIR